MLPGYSPSAHTHTATLPGAAGTQQLPTPGRSNRTSPAARPSPRQEQLGEPPEGSRRLCAPGPRTGVTPLGGSGGRPRRCSPAGGRRSPALPELGASLPPSPSAAGSGAGGSGTRSPHSPRPSSLRRCRADVGARRGAPPAPPLPRLSPGARAEESRRVNPPGGGGDGDEPRSARSWRRPLPRTKLRRRRRCAAGLPLQPRGAAPPLAPRPGEQRCTAAASAPLFLRLPGAALRAQRRGHPEPRGGAAAASLGASEPAAAAPRRRPLRMPLAPPLPLLPPAAAPPPALPRTTAAARAPLSAASPSPAAAAAAARRGGIREGAATAPRGPAPPRRCPGCAGVAVAGMSVPGAGGAGAGGNRRPPGCSRAGRRRCPRCPPAPGEGGCRLWRVPAQHVPTRGSPAEAALRRCQLGGRSPWRAGFVAAGQVRCFPVSPLLRWHLLHPRLTCALEVGMVGEDEWGPRGTGSSILCLVLGVSSSSQLLAGPRVPLA